MESLRLTVKCACGSGSQAVQMDPEAVQAMGFHRFCAKHHIIKPKGPELDEIVATAVEVVGYITGPSLCSVRACTLHGYVPACFHCTVMLYSKHVVTITELVDCYCYFCSEIHEYAVIHNILY